MLPFSFAALASEIRFELFTVGYWLPLTGAVLFVLWARFVWLVTDPARIEDVSSRKDAA